MMLLTLFLLFPLLGWANDIVLYLGGNCWTGQASVSCRNIDERTCCRASAPFCGVAQCVGCPVYTIVLTYFGSDCSGKSNRWCKIRHLDRKHWGCCVDLGFEDTCAAMWATSSYQTDVDAATSEIACAQPNVMTYVDNGVQREIHIPEGELQNATQLLLANDFEGLKHFADWAGQQ
ncbi:hypothetical protein QBC40DRAFT_351880 [Triangularia verruculosa]|uniref:Uncharacterized protein n=1 Tax=Triangularia verruculosa TaxID=2587418 RepID=A0AAN6XB17_9PEZI|nr:hypothetical protein QBC40DRAFT_351880 [Triangularia verruculosa]